jgi:hypothetical protein
VSLTLPYRKVPYPKAAGGFGYMAVMSVQIARPEKNAPRSKRVETFIDSGATNCVFHAQIGESLGIDIKAGEVEKTTGITGSATLYMHEITIYAMGDPYLIRAGFSYELPVAGILGMMGFFDHFKVTFDPTAMACTLDRIYHA